MSLTRVPGAVRHADPEQTLADAARRFDLQLRSQVMPYWFDEGQDRQCGGYSLEQGSKQLVGQTRMIWGFSHAHRQGLSTPQRDYLQAARQGYEFLQQHFRDQEHGGYYWMTDDAGSPTNRYKMIYGQAFVIYALVEYYRASQDMAALTAALEQFLVLQSKAHDRQFGGWFEHFTPDWTPVMTGEEHVSVEVPGYKSANAHLHLMEAFTELYMELPDDRVRDALAESLQINRTHFYPPDPAECAFHCRPDWSRVTDRVQCRPVVRAQRGVCLADAAGGAGAGSTAVVGSLLCLLDHALKYGFDHERGGLYNKGLDNQPAFDREKVWWSQAELMAALSVSLQHQQRASDLEACQKLVGFLEHTMIDPQDGIWVASVAPDGQPKWNSKKNHWKANYHDVRAIVMFIKALQDRDK